MEVWDELMKSALLGTRRHAYALKAGGDPLGATLAAIESDDNPSALLAAGAAIAVFRRAGRKAMVPAKLPQTPPAPPSGQDLPRVSDRAATHLEMMLGGTHGQVLAEWLALAAAAGRRVPEDHLPTLLDKCKADSDLRAAIIAVLGKRGLWLAGLNIDWAYAAGGAEGGDPQETWQTGTRDARIALLNRMRKLDPAAARDLVMSTWSQDSSDDRGRFLAAFAAGLSDADEPFLEECLDDKRKEVRAAAVGLLARLPASRMAARMKARLGPVLVFQGGKKPIEIALPAECDKALIRDGVDPKLSLGGKSGEKAGWVRQMAACVPPSHWSNLWKVEPDKLVRLAAAGDWAELLHGAWAAAAASFRDEAWAEALLRWGETNNVLELGETLRPATRERLVLERLSGKKARLHGEKGGLQTLHLLNACRHAWSREFTDRILEVLRFTAEGEYDWSVGSMLPELALYADSSSASAAGAAWPTEAATYDAWRNAVDRFTGLLRFRGELREGFEEIVF